MARSRSSGPVPVGRGNLGTDGGVSRAPQAASRSGGTETDAAVRAGDEIRRRLTTGYEIVASRGRRRGPATVDDRISWRRSAAPARFSARIRAGGPVAGGRTKPGAKSVGRSNCRDISTCLLEPAGFSPEYRWRSGRLFWSREPESSVADLAGMDRRRGRATGGPRWRRWKSVCLRNVRTAAASRFPGHEPVGHRADRRRGGAVSGTGAGEMAGDAARR